MKIEFGPVSDKVKGAALFTVSFALVQGIFYGVWNATGGSMQGEFLVSMMSPCILVGVLGSFWGLTLSGEKESYLMCAREILPTLPYLFSNVHKKSAQVV